MNVTSRCGPRVISIMVSHFRSDGTRQSNDGGEGLCCIIDAQRSVRCLNVHGGPTAWCRGRMDITGRQE